IVLRDARHIQVIGTRVSSCLILVASDSASRTSTRSLLAHLLSRSPFIICQQLVRDRIVASMSACHVDDPGSVPGLGGFVKEHDEHRERYTLPRSKSNGRTKCVYQVRRSISVGQRLGITTTLSFCVCFF